MGLARTAGKARASGGGVRRTWKDRGERVLLNTPNYELDSSRGRIRHTVTGSCASLRSWTLQFSTSIFLTGTSWMYTVGWQSSAIRSTRPR